MPKLRAIAKRTIIDSKKLAWQHFTKTLTTSTPPSEVWGKIKAMKNIPVHKNIKFLQTNTLNLTASIDIANELGPFSLIDEDLRALNDEITISEIMLSLNKSKSKSCGPDNIPIDFIRHLPTQGINLILKIFNKLYLTNKFPKQWKKATIIPILKSSNNQHTTEGYRPISLLCALSKLLERIINNRLSWYLEKKNLLDEKQFGFRKQRSTYDCLTNIETEIRDTFATKQSMILICLDICKAYDTVWRYKVLTTLYNWGIHGNIHAYLQHFLSDRSFIVKVNNTFSEKFTLVNGVVQGSPISVTLFLIAINEVTKIIKLLTHINIFADDINLHCKGKNNKSILENIQLSVNIINDWSKKNGFRFSSTKSKCIVFSKKTKKALKPEIKLNNVVIPLVNNIKILGMTFDNKLNWNKHFSVLKTNTSKTTNIIKILANNKWGAQSKILHNVYKTLNRSKIEYGAIIYGSAKSTSLEKLETIQNNNLRLITGAFKSSPIKSLLCITGEISLEKRRKLLELQYAFKIASYLNNPTYNSLFNKRYNNAYYLQTNINKPIGRRIENFFNAHNINPKHIIKSEILTKPPWRPNNFEIDFSFAVNNKGNTAPQLFRNLFKEKTQNRDQVLVFTDASKTENNIAFAIIINGSEYKFRLPTLNSIFTAEALTIQKVIHIIKEMPNNTFNILTDSLSTLLSIQNPQKNNEITNNIINLLNNTNKLITLTWIPSHTGIEGNERADMMAKQATSDQTIEILNLLSKNDLKREAKNIISNLWRKEWHFLTDNKLREIKPTTDRWINPSNITRQQEVILTRLRIGHSWHTHKHLMDKTDSEPCITCGSNISNKHLLLECRQFNEERIKHNIPSSIAVCPNNEPQNINSTLSFIRDTNLYKTI
ncbi:uncharacterized protein LOC112690014 [Sipha flava]|uniref:Uncharacterized protein LOC112690014 n=1 Tax=Sipha flava TaxID=143950 RepID=A0A8B8G8Z8_9HEMI|nr:uncharacterized protein LOC112690014 [Sipha flava]